MGNVSTKFPRNLKGRILVSKRKAESNKIR